MDCPVGVGQAARAAFLLPRAPHSCLCAGTKADFTSLDQWERELQLYNAIKALPVFKQYKEWKNFKVRDFLLPDADFF